MFERVLFGTWLVVFVACMTFGVFAHYCVIKQALGYGTAYCTNKVETVRR